MLGALEVPQGPLKPMLLSVSWKGVSTALHTRGLVLPGESQQLGQAPQHRNDNSLHREARAMHQVLV